MNEEKTALCCKCFPLPKDYSYIKDNYEKWVKNTSKDQYDQIYEIWLLFPMLIPLNIVKKTEKGEFHHYSCKHLINNKCSIQYHKPEMCKIFNAENCKNNYPECLSDCFGQKGI